MAMILTVTTVSNLERIEAALRSFSAVLVQGEIGSGKSICVSHLAERCGVSDTMLHVDVDDSIDSKDLLGKFVASQTPGMFEWVAGPLTTAVEKGLWILMEDVDLASFDVFSVLLSLLESGSLYLADQNRTVTMHPNFKLIATQQLCVSSASSLTSKRSHAVPFTELWGTAILDPLPANEARTIICSSYPAVPVPIVDAFTSIVVAAPHLIPVFSLRRLLQWARRVSRRLGQGTESGTAEARGGVPSSFLSSTTRELVLREAFDIFVARFPPGQEQQTALALVAAACGVEPNVAEVLSLECKPSVARLPGVYQVGRVSLQSRATRVDLERLQQCIFAPTQHALALLERLAAAVDCGEHVLLTGETGVGKTYMVQHIADQVGQKLIVHNLNQQTDSADFMGGWKPVDLSCDVRALYTAFLDLFSASFNLEKNAGFLSALQSVMSARRWEKAVRHLCKGCEAYRAKRTAQQALDAPSATLAGATNGCAQQALDAQWEELESAVGAMLVKIQQAKTTYSFKFEEGSLVTAWREGHWILLDELNLATNEVLERVSSVLGDVDKLFLTERGDMTPIRRHPNFRVFANMNPPTDVGKKDLPPSLRSRFTELYVAEPFNQADIRVVVKEYIGYLSHEAKVDEITAFFLDCVHNAKSLLCALDGETKLPSFSLRTLTRALQYVRKAAALYGFTNALYDGLTLGFATPLSKKYHAVLEELIVKDVFKGRRPPAPRLPALPGGQGKFAAYEHMWIVAGDGMCHRDESFILTESVRKHLTNLARAVFVSRPVLLEGPTSSGKSSMVKYLAQLTGNTFVRINNHDSTEVQEYLGHYVTDEQGKLHFVDGILVNAVRHGYWVVLDELNLAPTDVLESLNRLLDDNCELFVPDTQETIKPHPRLRIFATQNPAGAYGGRKMLSRAFRNRFLEMTVDDIPTEEISVILQRRYTLPASFAEKMVEVMSALQLRRQGSQVFAGRHGFVTPRDLFRWAERKPETYTELAEHGFLLLGERCRKDEERQIVKDLMENIMKTEIDEAQLYNPEHWSFVRPYYALVQSNGDDDDDEETGDGDGANRRCLWRDFGIVWTTSMQRLFTTVGLCIQHQEPVLLVGETGSSKTTVCQLWAALLKTPLYILNCHQHTEAADFLGGLRPTPPERRTQSLFEWHNGPLVHSMIEGGLFVLDEISLTEDSVLERLNSVLEPGRSVTLAEKSSADCITAHEQFRIMATMNPGGDFGKKELSPALRNRFTEIYVRPTTQPEEIAQILSRRLHPCLTSWAIHMADILCHVSTSPELLLLGESDRSRQGGAATRVTPVTATSTQHVSIRDVVSWAEFMNAVQSCCPRGDYAFLHGFDAVIADGIGIGTGQSETAAHELRRRLLLLAHQHMRRHAEQTRTTTQLYSLPDKQDDEAEQEEESITRAVSHPVNAASDLDHVQSVLAQPFWEVVDDMQVPTLPPALQSRYFFGTAATRRNLSKLMRAGVVRKAVLLEGSPGVGKTSIVEALGAALGHRVVRINLSEQTDMMDLFGTFLPSPNTDHDDEAKGGDAWDEDVRRSGEAKGSGTDFSDTCTTKTPAGPQFVWSDGVLLRAVKQGEWVILDELNLASQSVLEGLNALLDHRAAVFIPELNASFHAHANFRVFACQNPLGEGGGRKGLPRSFLNRFLKVRVEPFDESDLLSVGRVLFPRLKDHTLRCMVRFVAALQHETMVQRGFATRGSPWEFNLRDILRWASMMDHFDAHEEACAVGEVLFVQRMRTDADVRRCRALLRRCLSEPLADNEDAPETTRSGAGVASRKERVATTPHSSSLSASSTPVDSELEQSETRDESFLLHGDVLYAGRQWLCRRRWQSATTHPHSAVCGLLSEQHEHTDNLNYDNNNNNNNNISSSSSNIQTNASACTDRDNYTNNTSIVTPVCVNASLHDTQGESALSFPPLAPAPHSSALFLLPTQHATVRALLMCAEMSQFALLVGSAGCGKSCALQTAAALAGARLVTFAMNASCDTVDLLGGFHQVDGKQGEFEWRDSRVLQAMIAGDWLVLDHVNYCAPSVLDRLNPLVEPDGVLAVNEQGLVEGCVRVVRPHPHFRLFATLNPSYGEISRAMRNRAVELHLTAPPVPSLEAAILANSVLTHTREEGVGSVVPAPLCAQRHRADCLSHRNDTREAEQEHTKEEMRVLAVFMSLMQSPARADADTAAMVRCILRFHEVFVRTGFHAHTRHTGTAELADAIAAGAPHLVTILRTAAMLAVEQRQPLYKDVSCTPADTAHESLKCATDSLLLLHQDKDEEGALHDSTNETTLPEEKARLLQRVLGHRYLDNRAGHWRAHHAELHRQLGEMLGLGTPASPSLPCRALGTVAGTEVAMEAPLSEAMRCAQLQPSPFPAVGLSELLSYQRVRKAALALLTHRLANPMRVRAVSSSSGDDDEHHHVLDDVLPEEDAERALLMHFLLDQANDGTTPPALTQARRALLHSLYSTPPSTLLLSLDENAEKNGDGARGAALEAEVTMMPPASPNAAPAWVCAVVQTRFGGSSLCDNINSNSNSNDNNNSSNSCVVKEQSLYATVMQWVGPNARLLRLLQPGARMLPAMTFTDSHFVHVVARAVLRAGHAHASLLHDPQELQAFMMAWVPLAQALLQPPPSPRVTVEEVVSVAARACVLYEVVETAAAAAADEKQKEEEEEEESVTMDAALHTRSMCDEVQEDDSDVRNNRRDRSTRCCMSTRVRKGEVVECEETAQAPTHNADSSAHASVRHTRAAHRTHHRRHHRGLRRRSGCVDMTAPPQTPLGAAITTLLQQLQRYLQLPFALHTSRGPLRRCTHLVPHITTAEERAALQRWTRFGAVPHDARVVADKAAASALLPALYTTALVRAEFHLTQILLRCLHPCHSCNAQGNTYDSNSNSNDDTSHNYGNEDDSDAYYAAHVCDTPERCVWAPLRQLQRGIDDLVALTTRMAPATATLELTLWRAVSSLIAQALKQVRNARRVQSQSQSQSQLERHTKDEEKAIVWVMQALSQYRALLMTRLLTRYGVAMVTHLLSGSWAAAAAACVRRASAATLAHMDEEETNDANTPNVWGRGLPSLLVSTHSADARMRRSAPWGSSAEESTDAANTEEHNKSMEDTQNECNSDVAGAASFPPPTPAQLLRGIALFAQCCPRRPRRSWQLMQSNARAEMQSMMQQCVPLSPVNETGTAQEVALCSDATDAAAARVTEQSEQTKRPDYGEGVGVVVVVPAAEQGRRRRTRWEMDEDSAQHETRRHAELHMRSTPSVTCAPMADTCSCAPPSASTRTHSVSNRVDSYAAAMTAIVAARDTPALAPHDTLLRVIASQLEQVTCARSSSSSSESSSLGLTRRYTTVALIYILRCRLLLPQGGVDPSYCESLAASAAASEADRLDRLGALFRWADALTQRPLVSDDANSRSSSSSSSSLSSMSSQTRLLARLQQRAAREADVRNGRVVARPPEKADEREGKGYAAVVRRLHQLSDTLLSDGRVMAVMGLENAATALQRTSYPSSSSSCCALYNGHVSTSRVDEEVHASSTRTDECRVGGRFSRAGDANRPAGGMDVGAVEDDARSARRCWCALVFQEATELLGRFGGYEDVTMPFAESALLAVAAAHASCYLDPIANYTNIHAGEEEEKEEKGANVSLESCSLEHVHHTHHSRTTTTAASSTAQTTHAHDTQQRHSPPHSRTLFDRPTTLALLQFPSAVAHEPPLPHLSPFPHAETKDSHTALDSVTGHETHLHAAVVSPPRPPLHDHLHFLDAQLSRIRGGVPQSVPTHFAQSLFAHYAALYERVEDWEAYERRQQEATVRYKERALVIEGDDEAALRRLREHFPSYESEFVRAAEEADNNADETADNENGAEEGGGALGMRERSTPSAPRGRGERAVRGMFHSRAGWYVRRLVDSFARYHEALVCGVRVSHGSVTRRPEVQEEDVMAGFAMQFDVLAGQLHRLRVEETAHSQPTRFAHAETNAYNGCTEAKADDDDGCAMRDSAEETDSDAEEDCAEASLMTGFVTRAALLQRALHPSSSSTHPMDLVLDDEVLDADYDHDEVRLSSAASPHRRHGSSAARTFKSSSHAAPETRSFSPATNPHHCNTFNMYHDSAPDEVMQHLRPVLHSLGRHMTHLMPRYPDSVALQRCHRVLQRLAHLPLLHTPLMRVLTGCEVLLRECYAWERNASTSVSWLREMEALSAVVLRWRRMELHGWRALLHARRAEFVLPALMHWFRFYASIMVPLTSVEEDADTHETNGDEAHEGEENEEEATSTAPHTRMHAHASSSVHVSKPASESSCLTMNRVPLLPNTTHDAKLVHTCALQTRCRAILRQLSDYLWHAQLGDFRGRLRLVRGFAHAMLHQHGPLHPLTHITRHMHDYFAQFASLVRRRRGELVAPVEHELADFTRVMRWEDANYHAVRATTEKSHLKLARAMAEVEGVLRRSVRELVTTEEQTAEEAVRLLTGNEQQQDEEEREEEHAKRRRRTRKGNVHDDDTGGVEKSTSLSRKKSQLHALQRSNGSTSGSNQTNAATDKGGKAVTHRAKSRQRRTHAHTERTDSEDDNNTPAHLAHTDRKAQAADSLWCVAAVQQGTTFLQHASKTIQQRVQSLQRPGTAQGMKTRALKTLFEAMTTAGLTHRREEVGGVTDWEDMFVTAVSLRAMHMYAAGVLLSSAGEADEDGGCGEVGTGGSAWLLTRGVHGFYRGVRAVQRMREVSAGVVHADLTQAQVRHGTGLVECGFVHVRQTVQLVVALLRLRCELRVLRERVGEEQTQTQQHRQQQQQQQQQQDKENRNATSERVNVSASGESAESMESAHTDVHEMSKRSRHEHEQHERKQTVLHSSAVHRCGTRESDASLHRKGEETSDTLCDAAEAHTVLDECVRVCAVAYTLKAAVRWTDDCHACSSHGIRSDPSCSPVTPTSVHDASHPCAHPSQKVHVQHRATATEPRANSFAASSSSSMLARRECAAWVEAVDELWAVCASHEALRRAREAHVPSRIWRERYTPALQRVLSASTAWMHSLYHTPDGNTAITNATSVKNSNPNTSVALMQNDMSQECYDATGVRHVATASVLSRWTNEVCGAMQRVEALARRPAQPGSAWRCAVWAILQSGTRALASDSHSSSWRSKHDDHDKNNANSDAEEDDKDDSAEENVYARLVRSIGEMESAVTHTHTQLTRVLRCRDDADELSDMCDDLTSSCTTKSPTHHVNVAHHLHDAPNTLLVDTNSHAEVPCTTTGAAVNHQSLPPSPTPSLSSLLDYTHTLESRAHVVQCTLLSTLAAQLRCNFTLARLFTVLMQKGFCKTESEESGEGDGDGGEGGDGANGALQSGTGMDDGHGEKDVTDEMTCEDQLMNEKDKKEAPPADDGADEKDGNKKDDEKDENGDEEEKEDHAADVETDFAGVKESRDESEEDEDGNDSDSEQEMGEVDDDDDEEGGGRDRKRSKLDRGDDASSMREDTGGADAEEVPPDDLATPPGEDEEEGKEKDESGDEEGDAETGGFENVEEALQTRDAHTEGAKASAEEREMLADASMDEDDDEGDDSTSGATSEDGDDEGEEDEGDADTVTESDDESSASGQDGEMSDAESDKDAEGASEADSRSSEGDDDRAHGPSDVDSENANETDSRTRGDDTTHVGSEDDDEDANEKDHANSAQAPTRGGGDGRRRRRRRQQQQRHTSPESGDNAPHDAPPPPRRAAAPPSAAESDVDDTQSELHTNGHDDADDRTPKDRAAEDSLRPDDPSLPQHEEDDNHNNDDEETGRGDGVQTSSAAPTPHTRGAGGEAAAGDGGGAGRRRDDATASAEHDSTTPMSGSAATALNPYRVLQEAMKRWDGDKERRALRMDRQVGRAAPPPPPPAEEEHNETEQDLGEAVNSSESLAPMQSNQTFALDKDGTREGLAPVTEEEMGGGGEADETGDARVAATEDTDRGECAPNDEDSVNSDSNNMEEEEEEEEAPHDVSRRRPTTTTDEEEEEEEEDHSRRRASHGRTDSSPTREAAEEESSSAGARRRRRLTARRDDEPSSAEEEAVPEAAAHEDDALALAAAEQRRRRGAAMWAEHEMHVQSLAQQLCEQLRLILAPTQADKLQGDYKSGKRLNMKRIIPYIASQFKKDRIWLRRTRPHRRTYQVMLALDDSLSMQRNQAGEMSCRAVALIAKALQQLEVGEVGVACFGQQTRVLHELHESWLPDSGPRVFAELTFAQDSTRLATMLETTLDYLDAARERMRGQTRSTTAQLQQILFIISDGQITESRAELRARLVRAAEQRQVVVFILLDIAAAEKADGKPESKVEEAATPALLRGGGLSTAERLRRLRAARDSRLRRVQSNSVLDMQMVNFVQGKVVRRAYMDDFPFPYYLVVRDLHHLPDTIADAMRQWFELLNPTV